MPNSRHPRPAPASSSHDDDLEPESPLPIRITGDWIYGHNPNPVQTWQHDDLEPAPMPTSTWEPPNTFYLTRNTPNPSIPTRNTPTTSTPPAANQPNNNCYAPIPSDIFLSPAASTAPPTCMICTTSTLAVPRMPLPPIPGEPSTYPPAPNPDQETPSLLPCGHVFGAACLQTWLATQPEDEDTPRSESSNKCPICRFALHYELCPHPIAPFPLTRTGLLFGLCPKTLPAGGSVGARCPQCRQATDTRVTAELCAPLAERYYALMVKCEAWRRLGERDEVDKVEQEMARVMTGMDGLRDALGREAERRW